MEGSRFLQKPLHSANINFRSSIENSKNVAEALQILADQLTAEQIIKLSKVALNPELKTLALAQLGA